MGDCVYDGMTRRPPVTAMGILMGDTNGVKGRRAPTLESDTELVRRLREFAVAQRISQVELERRTKVPQATLSRWFLLLEQGEPVPLRPKNRNAIRAFLESVETDATGQAVVLARRLAADILRDISDALRASAGEAPDQLLPPSVRRLVLGSTGSDRDAERRAALEDLLDNLGRQADEHPERRERA